jgi:hypothetical protein
MVEYSITAGQEMGMTTAARSPDGNLGYLFSVAYQAFRGRLAEALATYRLTVPQ